ncbi:MAG: maleate cis-trans isomerase family protein [Leucobacter sp.]
METVLLENLRGPTARVAIGVVAPCDMELDAELWRWMPDGVDLLTTRTPFVDDVVSVEFVQEVSKPRDVADGVRSVTTGRAEVVAYACTSGSFVLGKSGEAAIRGAMEDAGARDPLTTSGALVEALSALGVSRVSVATPYTPTLSQLLDTFLEEHGVSVLGHAALGLDTDIWDVEYQQTAELVRRANHADAEAIVISCTNLPTYDLIAPLERELGKPVISANQATMWAALRRIGCVAEGPGQALLGH